MEDGVGVEVDAGVVIFEDLAHDGGLFPGGAAVRVGSDFDVVVFVAVNLGCENYVRFVSVCRG